MRRLKIFTLDENTEWKAVTDSNEHINIKETDSVKFTVKLRTDEVEEQQKPILVINNIPYELIPEEREENSITFSSDFKDYDEKVFFNYFGESKIKLYLDSKSEASEKITINILARQENYLMAEDMLSYLNSRFLNIINLCFSKSNIRSGNSKYREPDISINIRKISSIIDHIDLNKKNFERNHKESWKNEIQFQDNGMIIDNESFLWVLNHLDLLSPSKLEKANFIWQGQAYNIQSIPNNTIKPDTNLYENQVIHSFLFSAKKTLSSARNHYVRSIKKAQSSAISGHDGYFHFDHVIKKFSKEILSYYLKKIDTCLLKIELTWSWINRAIPADIKPNVMPKVTAFTQNRIHYNKAFHLISEWYNLGEPDYQVQEHLLGLRNLSTIYEFFCLVALLESLNKLGFIQTKSSYKKYDFNLPFEGEDFDLPKATLNNFYTLKNRDIKITAMYEPKIYRFRSHLKEGDLFNISRTSKRYIDHHLSPDFILKIEANEIDNPIIIILDAKYTNAVNVNKYKIKELIQKYLLGIHQVSTSPINASPIQMVHALFSHGNKGNRASYYREIHQLSGEMPILPAIGGTLVTPKSTDDLDDLMHSFLRYIFPNRQWQHEEIQNTPRKLPA